MRICLGIPVPYASGGKGSFHRERSFHRQREGHFIEGYNRTIKSEELRAESPEISAELPKISAELP